MSLLEFKHINPDYLRFRASYVGFERETVRFDPKEMVYNVYVNDKIIVKFNMEGDRLEK